MYEEEGDSERRQDTGQERDIERETEEAKEEVARLEDDPPERLEDWPDGKAKYETFGGPAHESSYDDSATAKLGPSDVRHRADGTVEVRGEEVDDPGEYKGELIPGGPTDPDAPSGPKAREERHDELEGKDD